MKKSSIALIALLFAAAGAAQAHIEIFTATLSGPNEAPSNSSPGHGTATITFDLDLVTMRVQASFADLVGITTASHIHCCTTLPGVGTAIVATQTPTFVGFPLGVTSGTYDHTFDLTVPGSYNASFVTAKGGTVSGALNALLAGIDAGDAYLNIHTRSFPGGEIRGFLIPVPEPATYGMMMLGLGLVGLRGAMRRRHRS
jgi:hypothetical protein